MKKTPATQTTLTDLKNWSGDFNDLVSTANDVLPSLNRSAAPITPRLVRRYQEAGAVGRGKREGKSSRFGWNELAALAMTKAIVQGGWPLEGAAALVSSTPTEALATRLTGEAAGDATAVGEPSPASRAQKVISELVYQTQPVVTLPGRLTSTATRASAQCANAQSGGVNWMAGGAVSGMASGFAGSSGEVSPGLAAAPLVAEAQPETWHKHAVVPWLEVSIAPDAAARASSAEVAQARDALRRIGEQLLPATRSTPKP